MVGVNVDEEARDEKALCLWQREPMIRFGLAGVCMTFDGMRDEERSGDSLEIAHVKCRLTL